LPSHNRRNTIFTAFEKNMDMVGHQDPCIYLALSVDDVFREPFEKSILILIVFKDRGLVYSPDYDVVQCSRCV
jgi:hypothetical protein